MLLEFSWWHLKMNNKIIPLAITILSTGCSLANSDFPNQCEVKDIDFKPLELVLNSATKPTKADVFLIYNQTRNPVTIEHPETIANLIKSWRATVDGKKWAALYRILS